MQNHDVAEKLIFQVDGETVDGLIKVDAIEVEEDTIEVPEFHKKRNISTGVKKIPKITATFKIRRNSANQKLLSDWFHNDESHDIVIISVDADGVEYRRHLYSDAECTKYTANNAYDAASPTFAQVNVILVPWDYVPIKV
jgi:hypothetical protein